jgi:diacylglycerol kinase (ATP)
VFLPANVAVIVNPTAGHGKTGRLWPALAAALRERGVAFDASFTGGPGDATSFAAQAVRAGYRLVIGVGGDGTLNEIVNGLFIDGPPDPTRVSLGIISSGTGCDLIKSLGIPNGLAGLDAALGDDSLLMDIGQVTFCAPDGETRRRYFLNEADLGIGVDVVGRVNRSSKRFGGFLSFLVSAATSIITSRPYEVRFRLDDGPEESIRTDLFYVANGRFSAGGMMFAPLASLDDGLFDIVTVQPVSRLQLLFEILPKVYGGKHLSHPKVIFHRARRVQVTSPNWLGLEMDGELPGEAPIEVQMLPRALRIAMQSGRQTRAGDDRTADLMNSARG